MLPTTGDTAASPPRRRWLLAAVATVAVLVAIIAFSRPDTIARVIESLGWSGAALVVALYATSQFLRTARVWIALRVVDRPTFRSLLGIVSMHQCLNHLLPFRVGEASFPLLMKRYAAVSAATSISLLLVVRLQELAVLVVFFGGALVGRSFQANGGFPTSWLLALAAAGAVVLAAVSRILPILLGAASTMLRGAKPLPSLAAGKERIAGFLDRLRAEWIAPVSPARRGLAWLLTIAIWFNTCLISLEGLRYSGLKISYLETVLGSTVASLSNVLPINAFGSFGSIEAGWTFGFAALGFDPRNVLAVAFVFHILLMLFLVVAALISWAWLHTARKGGAAPARFE